MSSTNISTCALVGTTTLLIRCANILKEQGHKIAIIISDDEAVINWSLSQGIRYSKQIKELSHYNFEYLFSIVNPYLLSQDTIALATEFAINYHDSPLPKYAGVHATSWAILNDEKKHATTWHCLEKLVDSGDILQQSWFDVDATDTAFTLNLKCYDQAASDFNSLMRDINEGKINSVKQSLSQRSYFGLHEKPAANGFINWYSSAKEIDQLVRALTFGDYQNKLALPKIILGDRVVIPQKTSIATSQSTLPAGTIVSQSATALRVSTLSNDIEIQTLLDLQGNILSIPDLNIETGYKLVLLNPEQQEYYKNTAVTLSKHEDYWVNELRTARETRRTFKGASQENLQWTISLGEGSSTVVDSNNLFFNIIIYLYQMLNDEFLTVKVSHPSLTLLNKDTENFYSSHIPFHFSAVDRSSIRSAREKVLKNLKTHIDNQSFARDVYRRYPALNNHYENIAILIAFSHSQPEVLLKEGVKVVFNLSERADKLELSCHVAAGIEPSLIELFQEMQLQIENYILPEHDDINIADFYLLNKDKENCELIHSKDNYLYDQSLTIPELFDSVAEQYPDNTAIVDDTVRITYHELQELISKTANLIKQKYKTCYQSELKINDVISVHAHSGKHYAIFTLAILKLGCAYSPVDPDYPLERKKYLFQNSTSRLVLTDEDINDIDTPSLTLTYDSIKKLMYYPLANAKADIMYILHTSGSTGKPKGVMIQQKSFINLLNWYKKLGPGKSIKTLVTTSFSFDLTQKNIFAPLILAGELHFRKPTSFYDSDAIVEYVAHEKIQHINCTPSMFFPLMSTPEKIKKIHSLTHVVLGGEAFNGAKFKYLIQQTPHLHLYNTYGPTECTDVCAYYKVTHKDIENGKNIPIGLPVDNTQIIILNDELKCVTAGQIGELAVTGVCVGKGYLHDQQKTGQKFLDVQPFSNDDTQCFVYLTGDLAKLLPSGNVEFINRSDHQVKINGYRIEPGEISAELNSHPNVLESVVIVKSYSQDTIKRLIAFVVPLVEDDMLVRKISGYLANRLPSFMVPHTIILLDALPLNKHGKADFEALAALTDNTENVDVAKTEVERKLLKIIKDVLFINAKMQDNFFSLGGDSLTAARLSAEITSQFSVSLSLIQIYTNPVISVLADLIERTKLFKKSRKKPAAIKTNATAILATSEQKRLWFIDQAYPAERTAYNLPILIELQGEVNIQAFLAAFNTVINEHEILRTRFESNSDGIIQIIESKLELNIIYEETANKSDAIKYIKACYHQPFTLTSLPLFKAYLISIKDTGSKLLFINMHHIIGDGETTTILMRYLINYYHQFNCATVPDTFKHVQYSDYSRWQAKYINSTGFKKKLKSYQNYLNKMSPLTLSSSDASNLISDHMLGKSEYFTIPVAQLTKLRTVALDNNTTLYIVLFSIFALQLNYYTQQENITLATPVSTRVDKKFNATLGLFINTLILSVNIDPTFKFPKLLKSISKQILQSYEYRDVPFDKISALLRQQSIQNNDSLFNVFFELIAPEYLGEFLIPGLKGKAITNVDFGIAKFDFTLRIFNTDLNNNAAIEYNTQIYTTEFINEFIQHFLELITLVTEHTECRLLELVPSIAATSKLPSERARHNYNLVSNNCLFNLFIYASKLNARNPAVKDAISVFSYEDLLSRVYKYSHWLKGVGVNPKKPVAIILNRDAGLLTAILSLIHLSVTFIPIDSELNEDRISFLLENSNAEFVLQNNITNLRIPKNIQPIYLDTANLDQYKAEPSNIQVPKIDYVAYIIFTSGSTGIPKAVAIGYNALSNILVALQSQLSITYNDNFLFSTSISFDIALAELLLPIISGSLCYIADKKLLREPEQLNQVLAENQLRVMQGTPSLWQGLIAMNWHYPGRLKILCGGEILMSSLAQALLRRTTELYNLYGPTETTIWATAHQIRDISELKNNSLPIGLPLPGVETYVLDKFKRPLPNNVVGELYIGGIGVAMGYFNDRAINKQKFIQNPFSRLNNKLFKTGDLVMWHQDGNLIFIGRNDRQIKLSGYRIELDEIEATIKQHPSINQCAVIFNKTKNQIIAFINFNVIHIGENVETSAWLDSVKTHLLMKLPEMLLPQVFNIAPVLPITPNGKIDYKLLQEDQSRYVEQSSFKPPTITPIHLKIASIWQSILNLNDNNYSDSFFALGGNSFLALKMMYELNQALEVDLSISILFRYSSINLLVSYLQSTIKSEPATIQPINNLLSKRKLLTTKESL
jgi:amino acid adenylation domain-containing protein